MIVHRLRLSDGHCMHVEEHGNPSGLPVLVLHGGPGSGSSPLLWHGFDPTRWRIVCPDQRGAGRSTPAGATWANTLADLLADLRRLRTHLSIARWIVAGGSWGATLALMHAIDEPHAVAGLALRNPFLARPADVHGFFAAAARHGGSAWDALWNDAHERRCSISLLLDEIFSRGTPARQREMARCWFAWEQRMAGATSALQPDAIQLQRLVARYRVQSHYLRHGCWLDAPTLLERCTAIPDVPIWIVQGLRDAVCPPEGAQALARTLGRRAMTAWVPDAGHHPAHPALAASWRRALDDLEQRFRAAAS